MIVDECIKLLLEQVKFNHTFFKKFSINFVKNSIVLKKKNLQNLIDVIKNDYDNIVDILIKGILSINQKNVNFFKIWISTNFIKLNDLFINMMIILRDYSNESINTIINLLSEKDQHGLEKNIYSKEKNKIEKYNISIIEYFKKLKQNFPRNLEIVDIYMYCLIFMGIILINTSFNMVVYNNIKYIKYKSVQNIFEVITDEEIIKNVKNVCKIIKPKLELIIKNPYGFLGIVFLLCGFGLMIYNAIIERKI